MRRTFTKHDDALLRQFYPTMLTAQLAEKMGRSIRSVYGRARVLGLKKNIAFLNGPNSGRLRKGNSGLGKRNQFPKGHVPVNKGKTWDEYMPKESQLKSIKTTFKKGQTPHNTLHDGAIVVRKDSNGRPYKFIRISKGKWLHLHVHIWKQSFGSVPKNHVVRFKDADTMNCDINNLELVSQKDNMIKNSIMRYPAELRETMRAIGKLNKIIENGKK